ncbi:putative RNA-binding protein 45 isoform X2, partial [Apostichopus japonicus]
TAHVRYKSPAFAAYARLKLNGLEFPEGCPLMIQFMGAPEIPKMGSPPLMSSGTAVSSPSFIKTSFNGPDSITCSIQLPPHQLLAPENSEVKERLFVILTRPLPDQVVQDVFCRFGQLISYYNIKGRNYGYAKFADAECAKIAMDTLHGQEVCGERL